MIQKTSTKETFVPFNTELYKALAQSETPEVRLNNHKAARILATDLDSEFPVAFAYRNHAGREAVSQCDSTGHNLRGVLELFVKVRTATRYMPLTPACDPFAILNQSLNNAQNDDGNINKIDQTSPEQSLEMNATTVWEPMLYTDAETAATRVDAVGVLTVEAYFVGGIIRWVEFMGRIKEVVSDGCGSVNDGRVDW